MNSFQFVILFKQSACHCLCSLPQGTVNELETVGWKEAADGVSNPTADEMLIAKKIERICGRCGADLKFKNKNCRGCMC